MSIPPINIANKRVAWLDITSIARPFANKVLGKRSPSILLLNEKSELQSTPEKKDIKLNVANSALRTVDFKGGLDKFLLSAKNVL